MENEKTKFESGVPATACMLAGGTIELGSNGDSAKTAPLRLLARSSKPIEHWFWGNVVHDFAGMRIHKNRLPVDYAHDSGEVIGYLANFNVLPEGLECNGALTPWRDDDRASELIAKMRAGVPYEASINFGGDGIKIQEIAAGEVTEVNGSEFAGPGIVIREWPLRGVAICPYGADANTESAEMKAKMFSLTKTEKINIGESDMSEQENTEALEAEAVELDAVDAVENAVQEPAEPEIIEPETPATDLTAIRTQFGDAIALEIAISGGTFADAQAMHYAQLKAENEELKAKAQVQTTETGEAEAAEFTADDDQAKALAADVRKWELKGLTPAQAKFAASCAKSKTKTKAKK